MCRTVDKKDARRTRVSGCVEESCISFIGERFSLLGGAGSSFPLDIGCEQHLGVQTRRAGACVDAAGGVGELLVEDEVAD